MRVLEKRGIELVRKKACRRRAGERKVGVPYNYKAQVDLTVLLLLAS